MEIRNNLAMQSDVTRPIRDGIKSRVEPLPREPEPKVTDKVGDKATDRARRRSVQTDGSGRDRAPSEPKVGGPESEPTEPSSIQKRGRRVRLQIKEELYEKRIRSARSRVIGRVRMGGMNKRKAIQELEQTTHTKGPDKAVLSDKAVSLSDTAARSDKVADIKLAFQEDRLNTRELIARTAFKMLDRQ